MHSPCLRAWTLLLVAGVSPAAEPQEPSFSRHVVPLFSRLGCNTGACHGAVQGKNGFRLSLFGSDPVADHARLLRESGGRRLNLADPDSSLLLLKGTGRVAHEGGPRFGVNSPEYQLLRRWIERGARLEAVEKSTVTRLTMTPSQQVLSVGRSYPLRVEATYADGSIADVTTLCYFESHNTSVAEVDRSGVVKIVGTGDTALLARYGWQPVIGGLLVPASLDTAFPTVKEHNFVDKHILDKLRRLNVPPADLCDDALFLRRTCLDVTGALPEPDEVRTFLADKSPDKRAKKIDELLQRPGHSALWATRWCDILRVRISYQDFTHAPAPASVQRFYEWLRARVRENTPYDEMMARMILSSSREGRSREEWIAEGVSLIEQESSETPWTAARKYAERKTLDLYWHRFDSTGVKGAMQFGHQWMGLRLQCAECHRHPSDVWTQDDLLSFSNFFMRLRANTGVLSVKEASDIKKSAGGGLTAAEKTKLQNDAKQLQEQAKKLEAEGKARKDDKSTAEKLKEEAKVLLNRAGAITRAIAVLDASEVFPTKGNPFGFAKVSSPLGTQASEQFRFLGQTNSLKIEEAQDPREQLVEWLRHPDNPFFAKALVNRVWAHYYGRGLIDPPDDLSPLNPSTHPELLQELCTEFVKNKYDLRWLHRTILMSRTYQQSGTPHPAGARDTRNYTYYYPKRLMAEIVVDALHQSTGTTEKLSTRLLPPGAKALEVPMSMADRNVGSPFTEFAFVVLGRPQRSTESVCDCERDGNPSLGQALFLANHPDVWKKIRAKEGRINRIASEQKDENRRVEEVFLWTLGRPPSEQEKSLCVEHVRKSGSVQKGLEGVMWSLMNSKEFVMNR